MKQNRVHAIILATALGGCLLLSFALFASLFVVHFNPLTGVYFYDPQNDRPNSFFLSNRPERILVQSLLKQVERDGGYPPGEKRKLIKVEPVRVDLATYSDWATEAKVTTRLQYQDGTVFLEVFRFRDSGSEGMLMPVVPGGEMSIHARFGNLGECSREGLDSSYCALKLEDS